MTIYQEIKALEPQLLSWRREIHKNPEFGFTLPKTTALVKRALSDLHIQFEEICESGLVGHIGKKGGKTILLRGDMDALPMTEETDLDFASQTSGAMHSCGHDAHTAMLLTAAAALKSHERELSGEVILMFQPAEEGLGGARAMLDAGILTKNKVDCAMAVHMASDIVKTNQLMLKAGPCSASSDGFTVTLHGKGGHGARPHQSVNPIICAMKIADAFTDIGRYEADAQQPTVATICTFHSGTAGNIIPEDCTFSGSLRTFNDELRQFILKRMREVAEKISEAYRCTLDLTLSTGTPPLVCNPEFAAQGRQWLVDGLACDGIDVPPLSSEKSMGSEDFAYVSNLVPSFVVSVGSTKCGDTAFPLHNPRIVFDEAGMAAGAAAYAQTALCYLK